MISDSHVHTYHSGDSKADINLVINEAINKKMPYLAITDHHDFLIENDRFVLNFDKYVPEIKVKDLTQIVLEMLSSLNSMKKSQERLIEITADGIIDDEEIKDFVFIQKELERISITVETLQLWVEQMIAEDKINKEKYAEMIGE